MPACYTGRSRAFGSGGRVGGIGGEGLRTQRISPGSANGLCCTGRLSGGEGETRLDLPLEGSRAFGVLLYQTSIKTASCMHCSCKVLVQCNTIIVIMVVFITYMSDLVTFSRPGHEEVAVKLEYLPVGIHSSALAEGDGRGRRVQGVLVLGLNQFPGVGSFQTWTIANILVYGEKNN